jgi:hypothetical protein
LNTGGSNSLPPPPPFYLFSELTSRLTRRLVNELESWRPVAAFNISGESNSPTANVTDVIYLFKNRKNFSHFTGSDELAVFT